MRYRRLLPICYPTTRTPPSGTVFFPEKVVLRISTTHSLFYLHSNGVSSGCVFVNVHASVLYVYLDSHRFLRLLRHLRVVRGSVVGPIRRQGDPSVTTVLAMSVLLCNGHFSGGLCLVSARYFHELGPFFPGSGGFSNFCL